MRGVCNQFAEYKRERFRKAEGRGQKKARKGLVYFGGLETFWKLRRALKYRKRGRLRDNKHAGGSGVWVGGEDRDEGIKKKRTGRTPQAPWIVFYTFFSKERRETKLEVREQGGNEDGSQVLKRVTDSLRVTRLSWGKFNIKLRNSRAGGNVAKSKCKPRSRRVGEGGKKPFDLKMTGEGGTTHSNNLRGVAWGGFKRNLLVENLSRLPLVRQSLDNFSALRNCCGGALRAY